MMRLYMLRHGQTLANVTHTYCGVTDLPLSEEGIRLLKEQKAAGGYPDITRLDVYTSGLLRTEQTLRLLYGDIPHSVMEQFAEMNFGIFEGRSYYELKDTEEYQTWISGDPFANVAPGGESGYQMQARVQKGIDELIKKDRDCLVVCHGGTIGGQFLYWFPDSGLNWYEIQPVNGCGYLFTIDGGRAVSWERIPIKE